MTSHAEKVTQLKHADLHALCEATEAAIRDGLGFNWTTPPSTEVLESYWKGVLVVPARELFVARLEGNIVGAIQLVKPPASKQSMAFAAKISNHFVAPWARGHGLAVELLTKAEEEARREGFLSIQLEVRETQARAIQIYEDHGYTRWGTLPHYEIVRGKRFAGHFYCKSIGLLPPRDEEE